MAQRAGRSIALLFHDHGTRRGECSAARPGRTLPPRKTRYPLYRRLVPPQGRSGRAENLAPPGFDPGSFQPVVRWLYRLSYPASFLKQRVLKATKPHAEHALLDKLNSLIPLDLILPRSILCYVVLLIP